MTRGAIAAAQKLAPEIAAASEQIEAEREIPPGLAGRMAEAGLFRLLMPEEVGWRGFLHAAEANCLFSHRLPPRLITQAIQLSLAVYSNEFTTASRQASSILWKITIYQEYGHWLFRMSFEGRVIIHL